MEEHCLLLCSLLLGFGLDAYVCFGTVASLVLHKTLKQGLGGKRRNCKWKCMGHDANFVQICLLLGLQIFSKVCSSCSVLSDWFSKNRIQIDGNKKHKYKTIECLFNHQKFYANNQMATNVHTCIFELENPRYWKVMKQQDIVSFLLYFCFFCFAKAAADCYCSSLTCPLSPSTLEVTQTELKLEDALRKLIVEYRTSEVVLIGELNRY